MSSTVEDLGPCRKRIAVTIETARIEAQYSKTYAELRNTVTIPGFRRGKTPRSVLEKRFAGHVANDVKRELILEGLSQGIKENGLDVVGDPEFDFEGIVLAPGTPLSFDVIVEIKPTFDLPGYDDLEATRNVAPVTEEEVDRVLASLRKDRSSWVPVEDRASATDDLVIGRLVLRDGEAEALKRDDAHVHVGTADRLAGLEVADVDDLFTGVKASSRIEFEADVPQEYPISALRGKHVTGVFTVEEVKQMEVPELDEELAISFGFESLQELKDRVRSDLTRRHEQAADEQVEEDLLDALLSRTDFPVPAIAVESTLKGRVDDELMSALMSGARIDQPIDKVRKELAERLRPDVTRSIRAWYLMEKIAKKERIFATENDFNREIERIAAQQRKTPTQVREEIAKNEAADQIRMGILEQKVRKFLTEGARIAEGSGDSAEGAEPTEKGSSPGGDQEQGGGSNE